MKVLFVLVIFTVLLLQSLFTQAGVMPLGCKHLETTWEPGHKAVNSHRKNILADSATTTAYKRPCFQGQADGQHPVWPPTATTTFINGLP